MRVIALIPPCKTGKKPARYSFLAEELTTMVDCGVEVYTVSPFVQKPTVLDGVKVHPIPRTRQLLHTLRSLSYANHFDNTFNKRLNISRTLKTVFDVLGQQQIDVIYSPFAWPSSTACIPAAKKANVPVIVSLRGVDVLVEESIGYGRLLDQESRRQMIRTLQNADHIIGVSQAMVDAAIELGADPDSVSVVLKGVHENRFCDGDATSARRSLKLGERPTVLFVGNLIPRKGMYCLIDAIKIVKATISGVQLVMCGDGRELNKVQNAIREAGLENDIVLVGRIDRQTIPDYFRACDVFVLPSLTEGSGNVIVEASASARPCIGTNYAGIPDYIDDGETGLLFEKNNSNDLAEKIIAILNDRAQAVRMGRAGRQRVERLHRYDHMIHQLLAIFQNVIEQHAAKLPNRNTTVTTTIRE